MSRKFAKITLLLVLFSILFVSVYTQDEDYNGYENDNDKNKENDNGNNNDDDDDSDLYRDFNCEHDKQDDKDDIEFTDVDEDGFQDAQEGRKLVSNPPNMRFYGYYGFMKSNNQYLSEELIPPILSYFEAALKVNYPVSGALKITTSSICGKSTPSVLRNGVNADFVYVFASEAGSGTWVASTKSCKLSTGSRRPLVGMTTVNTNKFKAANGNVMRHERNMYAIMHELTHTLGFSDSLFKYFLNDNGKVLSKPVISGSVGGKSTTVLNASPLTEMVRSHFGCSSAPGAHLENNGAKGATAGSHFERRLFGHEAMGGYLMGDMKYSKFTLALLESSGWYEPDYSYADPYYWGQGQGCSFFSTSCSNANKQFSEFCTASGRRCDVPRRAAGSCSSDTVSDGCKFVHPSNDYDCSNPDADSYARLPNLQTFGRGAGSQCFEGTLAASKSGSLTTFCFKSTCSGSGSNAVLNIQVGSKTVECTSAGSKTVAGYAGTITCPDPKEWCNTVGKKSCPLGCMGRGTCNNGVCSCYKGFKGQDCALNA